MKEIRGDAKTVQQLLKATKYSVDYYQREYKWQQKQIRELVDDLTSSFLEDYDPSHEPSEIQNYSHYFLGAIVVSRKDGKNYVVDGQQRLTSLTLLLMYLNNLQKTRNKKVNIEDLIFSDEFFDKSFNIDVAERNSCMEALFDDQPFDPTDQPESVQNLIVRYNDIKEHFPEDLTKEPLPFFIFWLTRNVHLVEITAYSDEDAYTIFETMNDRGLSLTPTEMLKGFLLAKITDSQKKNVADQLWKQRVRELTEYGKDIDADCLKTWFRSQYADSLRERKKGAKPQEFDRIGTEFHRWFKDAESKIGLNGSNSYAQFLQKDFNFYSKQYLRLIEASQRLTSGLEQIYYNAQLGFTTQYQLLLAPLYPDDPSDVVDLKLRLVSIYIDILLNRRLWNFKLITYNAMQYAMFVTMREIRRKDPKDLAVYLQTRLMSDTDTVPPFSNNDRLRLHQQNSNAIHRILARITDYIEQQSGLPSRFEEYMTAQGKAKYEIEHIWANHPDQHTDEFASASDFQEHRNRIGGLLLLPKSFNASYSDRPYNQKLPHYLGQNLLAKSLHPDCYNLNPGFLAFKNRSQLPFKPYTEFKKADLDDRQKLYQKIAEQIWNPQQLTQKAGV